ncbi:MAG: S1C family serine protease [Bacillota bacterium]
MRFRVGLILACVVGAVGNTSAGADDIGAAARGVVRVIAVAEGYSDADSGSISFGSGFAVSPHHIITNAHVVEDVENTYGDSIVAVVPSEGSRALHGTVIAYDRARDLAIIDVGPARLEPLAIYSGPVESGEHAAALGYPGNVDMATANSMYDLITPSAPVRSEGTISSKRNVEGTPAYLHTAAISRGNSGGPLVDDCGRVLGVNTYTTVTDSGDAPFGFAMVSQDLMSFLREHGEQFQQVGSACATMAELAQREQQAREAADRRQAIADQRAAYQQQQRVDSAKAAAEDSRQNHAAAAALLAVFALIAGAIAAALFLKDRTRAAAASAGLAAVGLVGGAYAFFSRPGLDVQVPQLTAPASAAAAPLTGKLLCRVQPELSRVTVSSTDDLPIEWDANGCMNGKTQYLQEDGKWRRVLVPNGSETVYVQDFDPAKGEYVSTRYLLSQAEMDQLRQIRGGTETKSCSSDPYAAQQLQQVTDRLVRSLPATPNERLVYHCTIQPN